MKLFWFYTSCFKLNVVATIKMFSIPTFKNLSQQHFSLFTFIINNTIFLFIEIKEVGRFLEQVFTGLYIEVNEVLSITQLFLKI